MRSAAYLGLGLLIALGAPVLAAPPGAQPPTVKVEGAAAQPTPAPGQTQPQAAAQARSAAARERRRAHSYASCNRGAYQRGLRGGARRRFLIRCRLGYERPRLPQGREPAALPQPKRKP